MWEQCVVLKDHPDTSLFRRQVNARPKDKLVAEPNLTCRWGYKACNRPKKTALSTARGAQEACDLPGCEIQAQAPNRR